MRNTFDGLAFSPAEILLPKNCEYAKWAVVACDQYTSQPEYWDEVERYVGSAPSALRLILPESCLGGPNMETDIMEINNTMTRYLREDRFQVFPDTLIYVERTLKNGKIRRGLVGKVDLEQYDYESDSDTAVRGTEGTVMSRIPPRVSVRKNAPIEMSHTMLLFDDPGRTVIEPLSARTDHMALAYDFDLMEDSGHLKGWRLDGESMDLVASAFHALFAKEKRGDLQFAVGDGNHALATAKECYERQKRLLPPEKWADLPARYALCEIVNLQDDSLEFEPIHRVIFHVQGKELLDALVEAIPGAYYGKGREKGSHTLHYLWGSAEGWITVPRPETCLPVMALQRFLDEYVPAHGGSIDYIHGEEVARDLAERGGNLAFLLQPLGKAELFSTVLREGILPRKTYSMGQACDKRFYLEARRIR